jgi:hypothetical protein
MSSTYRAICLSHDPAIEIYDDDGYDGLTWSDRETGLGALARRTGPLTAHKDCDLVLGAYSYPLWQITCPANSHREPGRYPRIGAPCWHNNDQAIQVDWLRLMIAAIVEPTPATRAVLEPRLIDSCWPKQRVMRLRSLLGVNGPYVAYEAPCGTCKEDQ